MRYLITAKDLEPYLTQWYTSENVFNPEIGMVVYDLVKDIYTTDGEEWKEIEMDHL